MTPIPEPVGYWARIFDAIANDPRAVATIAAAFLAFLFGTWVKYLFDLRRDNRLRAQQENDQALDKAVLAMGLRAELLSLQDYSTDRIRAIDKCRADPRGMSASRFASIDLPPQPVYANTTHRVGDLGAEASLAVVKAHGMAAHIRTNIAARRVADPFLTVDAELLTDTRGDLLVLLELTLGAVNALNVFLRDPPHYPNPQAILDEYAPAEPADPDLEKSNA